MLAAGFDDPPLPRDARITDLAPLALSHFGVLPPSTMRARVSAGV